MKIKKITKIILISIASIIVLIVAMLVIRNIVQKANKAESITYSVKKEVLENVIEISGNISAAQEQTMQAAGDGTVKKVYVSKGDLVKKGQIILELDTIEQEYNLAKHVYDMEQKRISGAKKELELMETQRQSLLQKIEDRKVIAYFDGIIVDLTVSEGDYVEAKDEVGTIIDRSYMKADVEIVENDVAKLEVGQIVYFTFPAYSDLEVQGYVESYPAVGRVTTRGATVVDAEVRIDNPPEEILPNYSFTGKIEISPAENILIVERYAIGYKYGKSFAQRILEDGTIEDVEVKVRPYDTSYILILSGLEENDVIKAQSDAGKSGNLRMNMNRSGQKNQTNQSNRGMGGNGGGNSPPSGGFGGF